MGRFMSPERMAEVNRQAAAAAQSEAEQRRLDPAQSAEVQREAEDLMRRDRQSEFGRTASVIIEGQDPDATRGIDTSAFEQLHHQIDRMEDAPPYHPAA